MAAYQPRVAALVAEVMSDLSRRLAELLLEVLDGLLAGQRPPVDSAIPIRASRRSTDRLW